MAPSMQQFLILLVLLLSQQSSALKCSCRSTFSDGTVTDAQLQQERNETASMLAPFGLDVRFPTDPCPADGQCETDSIQAPSEFGGYCWNYTGPFSPFSNTELGNATVQWRDCAKYVPVPPVLVGKGCLDLSPFGLAGATRCACNDSPSCNAGLRSSNTLPDAAQPTVNAPAAAERPGGPLKSCPVELLNQVYGDNVQLQFVQNSTSFALQLPTMAREAYIYFYNENQALTKMVDVAVNVSNPQFLSANGQHRVIPLTDPFFENTPPSLDFWYPVCLVLSYAVNFEDQTCNICTFVYPVNVNGLAELNLRYFYPQDFFALSDFSKSSTSATFVVKAASRIPAINTHISVQSAAKQIDARCTGAIQPGSFIQHGKISPNMATMIAVPVLPTDAYTLNLFYTINIPTEWPGPIRESTTYISLPTDIQTKLNVEPCFYCPPPITTIQCFPNAPQPLPPVQVAAPPPASLTPQVNANLPQQQLVPVPTGDGIRGEP